MEKVLRGIVPPLVTPLIDNDTIDDAGLERLVEHVIDGGVSGVFILGTTGEAQSISFELRYEMIKKTAHIVNKRVPLLVGISDTSLVDSISLANLAAEFGADAVVSANSVCGEVESTKSVSEIYAPISGKVVAINKKLDTNPETINSDPYGDGWIAEIEILGDKLSETLLSAREYEDLTA